MSATTSEELIVSNSKTRGRPKKDDQEKKDRAREYAKAYRATRAQEKADGIVHERSNRGRKGLTEEEKKEHRKMTNHAYFENNKQELMQAKCEKDKEARTVCKIVKELLEQNHPFPEDVDHQLRELTHVL